MVGRQQPAGDLEDARDYTWRFEFLPLEALRCATQDGEPPEGGWEDAHQRHLQADAQAVADGSPEYAGRAEWLRDVWGPCTQIYPIFVVQEDLEEGAFRLWDGHRRVAGAFQMKLARVAVLVGRPKAARGAAQAQS